VDARTEIEVSSSLPSFAATVMTPHLGLVGLAFFLHLYLPNARRHP